MRTPTKRGLISALIVAALVVVPVMVAAPAVASPKAVMASKEDSLQGPITKVNRAKHTFKLNDHHRGIVKIKANKRTRYEQLSGFGALHKGLKVDVNAHKKSGRWIADKIDRES